MRHGAALTSSLSFYIIDIYICFIVTDLVQRFFFFFFKEIGLKMACKGAGLDNRSGNQYVFNFACNFVLVVQAARPVVKPEVLSSCLSPANHRLRVTAAEQIV